MPAGLAGTVLPAPRPLGPFHLIDQDGLPFDRARLEGKWSFLFFGYTHCPDVCPMTLATLRRIREHLAAHPNGLDGTQFVFVSVDPERDTPAQLKSYVTYFGQGFLGATGADDQLQALTRPLGALYARPAESSGGEYAVDHTAAIFLIDPGAGFHALFSSPHEAEAIARTFLETRRREP